MSKNFIFIIMKKKTFLVTGGTGFIGSNICKLLVKKNYNLYIMNIIFKLFGKIKTPEGVATIGGATAGGWFGSSVGLAGFWGGIAGTFPIAIVGATVGYLGIKVIKYKRKLNQIKREEKSKKKLIVKTASYVAIIIAGIVIVFYLF